MHVGPEVFSCGGSRVGSGVLARSTYEVVLCGLCFVYMYTLYILYTMYILYIMYYILYCIM
jgi:hypothetical protein